MNKYFADFHIHIGRALGKPVKMAAAPSLTLENLFVHARESKGMDMVTVIDGVCTGVQQELSELVRDGRLVLMPGGGYEFENGLKVLLGAEIEIAGPYGGAAHFGTWFATLEQAADFSEWLATVQKNTSLSSQRARTDAYDLQQQVLSREGIFIVHHAFTPHKGLYGNCVAHMQEMLDPGSVDALELGLSADTDMADCLSELQNISFLSNSDAHSLPKIAREYNVLTMANPNFEEVRKALRRIQGRKVAANYGLEPALGKYHRTYCLNCGQLWPKLQTSCTCGSTKHVRGVYDRLLEIQDTPHPVHPPGRPGYVHQVPLEFIPGLGPKLRAKLLSAFSTEMRVLHEATVNELADVVGQALALRIDEARNGRLTIASGGGGVYGKVQAN